jgi:MFS family permease
MSSLKRPAFTRFWIGETATVLAYQMLVVAVGWQTYDLTESALALGFIGLFHFATQFTLLLPAGHFADRHDRRRIALGAQLVQLAVAAAYTGANLAGTMNTAFIYGGSLVIGAAQAFQNPSIRSMLPALVERKDLPQCIAWAGAARKMAVIAGPALGGVIYLVGPAYVYGTAAVFFVIAGILLVSVKMPHALRPHEPATLKTLFGGISYIRSNPVVLGAITLDLFATLLGGVTALLPIYARDILATGPSGLGILRAAPAVGAIVVSAVMVRAPLSRHVGRTMFVCVAVFGMATIVFGVSGSFALSVIALGVLGAADMISVVIRTSLIQLETPDHMRGRVSSVNSMFTSTSNQLGQFESGVVAALVGTVPSVVIGGVGTLIVAAVCVKLFPSLYRRDAMTH